MDKLWLNNYPEGVPADIDPNRYPSVASIIDKCCQKNSQAIAFSNEGSKLSYAQFFNYSRNFAAFLQQKLGMTKGDRIAIMMPNLLPYPVAVYGALQAGFVIVNINPFYTVDELSRILNDADVATVVVLNKFAATVLRVASQTPLKNIIVTKPGDLMSLLKAQIANRIVGYIKLKSTINLVFFKKALSMGKGLKLKAIEIKGDDLACIQYTGGTTGKIKGAMLTQRNLVANIEQINAWIRPVLNKDEQVVVTALPLYHIFAFVANLLLSIRIHSHNILITDPRKTNHFIKQLKKSQFSILLGVQTLFKRLLNHPKFSTLDFSHLKLALNGGMALEKQTEQRWKQITGHSLIQGYGLTETSPVVSIEAFDRKEFTGSSGMPLPSTEIRIIDKANNSLTIEEEGELCVRGPQVMRGYWQNAEETQSVLSSDGWLKTGDIAKIDRLGNLYLLDRIKNIILISGFNVYPIEVEAVINAHPGVNQSAVIGIPDEYTGERIKAYIIKDNPDLTEQKIIEHCRLHITTYKIPKEIEFVDKIPKSAVGKILHRVLRNNNHD